MFAPPSHLRVVEINTETQDWIFDAQPKGKREKRRCIPFFAEEPILGVGSYYYKTSLDWAPMEFWSEVIAYHLGRVIGVEVPVCFPCVLDGRPGCMAQDMLTLQKDSELVHGADLLMFSDPKYERNGKGERHSAQAIMRLLRAMERSHLYNDFFKIQVLDALIGNVDRHHENWALLVSSRAGDEPPIMRMSPAYDNGSSLLRNYDETKLENLYASQSGIDAYVRKGRSLVLWEDEGRYAALEHSELIAKHVDRWKPARAILAEVLSFSDDDAAVAIGMVAELSRTALPSIQITELRERCILQTVLAKRRRLIEVARL